MRKRIDSKTIFTKEYALIKLDCSKFQEQTRLEGYVIMKSLLAKRYCIGDVLLDTVDYNFMKTVLGSAMTEHVDRQGFAVVQEWLFRSPLLATMVNDYVGTNVIVTYDECLDNMLAEERR